MFDDLEKLRTSKLKTWISKNNLIQFVDYEKSGVLKISKDPPGISAHLKHDTIDGGTRGSQSHAQRLCSRTCEMYSNIVNYHKRNMYTTIIYY